MAVNLITNSLSTVFDEPEGVAVGNYSANGREIVFWSKNGLEVLNLSTMQRTVVRSTGALPGMQYYGGGISWSQAGDVFAVPLFNTGTKDYELLTISRDGTRAKTVYSSSEFKVLSVSFLRRQQLGR